MNDQKTEKRNFRRSLGFGMIYVVLITIIKTIEVIFNISFSRYGVYPLEPEGLIGIIFSPLIHGSWEHLINNSLPLFVLTTALFYFYQPVSFKVFFLVYFIHGFWLWFFARESYHIGASGIIYGLGSFLFVSGIIRKNSNLLAVSLLVAFLYGSMVWGIFPRIESVSWEAHLTGMASGILLAFYYKGYGPAANFGRWKYESLEDIETEDENLEDEFWNIPEENPYNDKNEKPQQD